MASINIDPLPFSQFEDLARNFAELDVSLGEEPRHRVAAFHDGNMLALIDLRPFAAGGIKQPMVEALAGLLALGATQFATALPGRAWSMDDPIPPVTNEGDLRQRVLMLTTAKDGDVRTWLLPFQLDDGELDWGETPSLDDEPALGWTSEALAIVSSSSEWKKDPMEASNQLGRCVALGHSVMLSPAGLKILESAPIPEMN